MIERYTLPEMGNLWSEQAKFQGWLDVELAACQANAELGRLPEEALQQIREKASFEVWRILEIEAEVRHDVIAFLTNVNEHVGDAGRGRRGRGGRDALEGYYYRTSCTQDVSQIHLHCPGARQTLPRMEARGSLYTPAAAAARAEWGRGGGDSGAEGGDRREHEDEEGDPPASAGRPGSAPGR